MKSSLPWIGSDFNASYINLDIAKLQGMQCNVYEITKINHKLLVTSHDRS